MSSNRKSFGLLPDGTEAELFTLRASGVEVDISNFGATIVAVRTPDRNGTWADIALGFHSALEYLERSGCHGATIGRYAGRIAGGRFSINGKAVKLEQNRGDHTIHGGPVGFHKRLWKVCRQEERCLELELFSPDGDQGFQGNLTVRAVFLLEKETLVLILRAVSDVDTPFNMTNHIYWNLGGHASGTVDDHILTVPAEKYLETDKENIPSGKILSVEGTPLDLRNPTPVETVHADHSLLLRTDGQMQSAGKIIHPDSGRRLEVSTNMPSVQVYTADHMAVVSGKDGTVYGPRRGMCLEAQFCPDSPNHSEFPDAVLPAGV